MYSSYEANLAKRRRHLPKVLPFHSYIFYFFRIFHTFDRRTLLTHTIRHVGSQTLCSLASPRQQHISE